MVEAVVFDMDGVIFDSERMIGECWVEEAAERGLCNIEEVVYGCVGLNKNDTVAFVKNFYGQDFPFDDYYSNVSAKYKSRVAAEGLPMKKGVLELLNYLKANKYKIALASSTSASGISRCLSRAGISAYFHPIIAGDMVVHSKPNPEIYRIACTRVDVRPDKAIAIEDSPNGIISAHGAGMLPVMVPDLIQPSEEIEKLLFAKCENLLDVILLLEQQKRK